MILLDEPFEGLAPLIVRDLVVGQSASAPQQGRTIVVVELNGGSGAVFGRSGLCAEQRARGVDWNAGLKVTPIRL